MLATKLPRTNVLPNSPRQMQQLHAPRPFPKQNIRTRVASLGLAQTRTPQQLTLRRTKNVIAPAELLRARLIAQIALSRISPLPERVLINMRAYAAKRKIALMAPAFATIIFAAEKHSGPLSANRKLQSPTVWLPRDLIGTSRNSNGTGFDGACGDIKFRHGDVSVSKGKALETV